VPTYAYSRTGLTHAFDDVADAIVRLTTAFVSGRGRAPSTALRAVPLPRFAGADAKLISPDERAVFRALDL
jgi:hypothetical protein